MSIATLKKKTAAKYNNVSVSQPVFSLNGTHRNQGYVGQTSVSRSLSRTLIRNGGYRNHGGCCGTFYVGPVVQSSISDVEDTNVVKVSTKNTLGLLHVNKYECLWRPAPYTVVKMDSNHNINSQSDYIKNVQKNALNDGSSCVGKPSNCNIVKPASELSAISQGEYLLGLDKACSVIDDTKIAQNRNNCNNCALPGN
jgi:hypothetical protein